MQKCFGEVHIRRVDMSINNFLSYLQQLLTMINPKDKYSVALGKSALSATIALAEASGKIDMETRHAMMMAKHQFEYLAENAEDFSGKPGNLVMNRKRRRRLLMVLMPGC